MDICIYSLLDIAVVYVINAVIIRRHYRIQIHYRVKSLSLHQCYRSISRYYTVFKYQPKN